MKRHRDDHAHCVMCRSVRHGTQLASVTSGDASGRSVETVPSRLLSETMSPNVGRRTGRLYRADVDHGCERSAARTPDPPIGTAPTGRRDHCCPSQWGGELRGQSPSLSKQSLLTRHTLKRSNESYRSRQQSADARRIEDSDQRRYSSGTGQQRPCGRSNENPRSIK